MIQLPEKGILLVPAHWHLPFYQEILKQKGNTLGIEMISLLSYVQRFIKKENPDQIALLYQAKQYLQSIPQSNPFYNSCKDTDFLQAALKFIRWTKSENVHNFPGNTEKHVALQPILETLDTLDLVEDNFSKVELGSQDNVYILEKVFSTQEQYWVDRLLENGAQFLSFDTTETIQYYGVANAKKQAKLIADTIVEKGWNAQDVSIHVCDKKDIAVTSQMLDANKIPYTILQEEQISPIAAKWVACLKWAQQPNKETLASLLETCFNDNQDILAYLDQCPDAYPEWKAHFTLKWQENTFLKEYEYQQLQELEQRALNWVEQHSIDWSITDFASMATLIQESIANPTKEDLALFNNIQNLISQASPYIKETEDLDILIHEIQNCSQTQSVSSLQGVCISSLQDICGLKEHVMVLGVHGQSFPALSIENGIFDENLIREIDVPSLQTRLNKQKEQRMHTLQQAKDITIVYPESNYDRKGNQTSVDIQRWILNQLQTGVQVEANIKEEKETEEIKVSPLAKVVIENDKTVRPDFSLTSQQAKDLLVDKGILSSSVSALQTYAQCPLHYFLQYGLRLQTPTDWTDVAQRGSLLHKILERAADDHNKQYAKISDQQLQTYIDQEFEFVWTLWPHRQFEFMLQKKDLFHTFKLIFQRLSQFEDMWHMNIDQQEYEYNADIDLGNCILHMHGFIDRLDVSASSFAIFDYKSGNKEWKQKEFETGKALQLATYAICAQEEIGKEPVGSFYISLKPTIKEQKAINPNRNNKKDPVEIEEEDLNEEFIHQIPYTGIYYSDITIYDDKGKNPKNGQSFYQQKEDWHTIVSSLVDDILSGNIAPNHEADACTYCDFASICRNARKEVEKKSRLKEVDE